MRDIGYSSHAGRRLFGLRRHKKGMNMKRFSWLFAILIAILIAPLLAQAQTEPPAAPETDIAERATPGRVSWQACPENAAVDCGVITLPVDYRKPKGEMFDMAVARIKATNPSKRIGVLFTNPGGPGISGVDFMIHVVPNVPLFATALERFDVISFDPRGVGRSRPIQCKPESGPLPEDRSDAALAAYFDDLGRRYAETCLAQDGAFVSKVSTNNVARDMDMLRRALGERKVTYASGSYGTLLGAVYASLFPNRLRAVALDGGIDPMFRDYYAEDTANQMAAFELELQRIDVLCSRDPACRLHDTGVVAAFDQLVAQLNTEPYTSPAGVVLTGASVSEVVYDLIYVEQLAPLIVDVLANGLNRDYTLMLAVLPNVDAGLSMAIYAIRCND
jgi:pimeloyl-ACP methyl ester carboxylesterase